MPLLALRLCAYSWHVINDDFREYLRERARRNVATWPPFTPEQRARLAVLLAPDLPNADPH